MGRSKVVVRKREVLPGHVQGGMSHFLLECHDITSVSEVVDGVLVPQIIGGKAGEARFLCVAAELECPCVGVHLCAVG